ncbi:MAG: hypothetical protein ACP5MK_02590 [Candidatus Micrarchaeia archaeon]
MFSALTGIRLVLSRKLFAASFAAMSILIFFAYSFLLQGSSLNLNTPKLMLGLDADALAVSAALGIMLALSISLNAFAMSRSIRSGSRMSVGAAVASVAPVMLCCSTIVPSLLATVGMGASAIISTAGMIQGPLATYEPALIAISLALLTLSIYVTSKNIAKSGECCVAKR